MKNIRRFNEELRPSTYRNAADKLTKMGHVRRGSELYKWGDTTQLKLDKAREIEKYNRLSKYPSFEMEIRRDKWNPNTKTREYGQEPIIRGNFLIDINFEDDMFNDQYNEWLYDPRYGFSLYFLIGIFPADDETRIKLKEVEEKLSEEVWDNSYYPTWMGIRMANANDSSINPGGDIHWDSRENDVLLFSNRREAFKFKRLLSDCFDGKNKFGEDKWQKEGVAQSVKDRFDKTRDEQVLRNVWIGNTDSIEQKEEKIRKSSELIGDKFLTMENYNDIVKAIKTMSINKMYRH